MKTPIFQKPRLIIVALTTLALAAGNVLAQDSSSSTFTSTKDAAVQPAVKDTSQAAPQLSYGVPEVLALSKAKVSDGTIINYIRNSGNNYGLNAAQIIYLRQQGVSSAVVNAMLDQRSQTAQTTSPASASQPVNSTTYNTEISTAPAQPAVTYVETVPSSSVYIIPDTQTYRYNNWFYYHSPYYSYYPYYRSYWPPSSVSVSYIGHRGWVGYRGGYHSGWYSGGFHRGSFRGGGWHRR